MKEDKKNRKQKNTGNNSVSFFNNLRLQIAVISVLVFIIYGKTISYDFIGLDEPTLIFENYPFIKDFSNIPQAFKQHIFQGRSHTEGTKDYYRPLLTVSFMIDAQLSPKAGPQAKYFHLFNILYHIIASMLLLILLRKLNTPHNVSFVLTVLFCTHPILAQAVAWIPGRNDSLIAIFALLSFIHFIDLSAEPEKKSLILHLLFFLMALFTKESAVGIIPVCFLYTVLFRKSFLKSKIFFYTAAGYVILFTGWFVLRSQALEGARNPITFSIIMDSLQENIPLLLQYIQKSILPFNLSVMSTVKDTNYIIGAIALLLIAIGFYFTHKNKRVFLIFGLAWFVLFITPSLTAKFFEGLEHRVYLPLIGMILFISRIPVFENLIVMRNKITISFIAAIFIVLCYIRLPVFTNRLVYWESAIKDSKNSSLACLNLGKTYEMMGKYREAIEAYREGLSRNPNQKLLHNNIGGAYIYMKMYEEAQVEIQKELELHPDNNFADYNMGLIKKLQGKTEESMMYFKKSVEKDTNFLQGYQQLADYYKKTNDTANFIFSVNKIKKLSK